MKKMLNMLVDKANRGLLCKIANAANLGPHGVNVAEVVGTLDQLLQDAARYEFLRDIDNFAMLREGCWTRLGKVEGEEFDRLVDEYMAAVKSYEQK